MSGCHPMTSRTMTCSGNGILIRINGISVRPVNISSVCCAEPLTVICSTLIRARGRSVGRALEINADLCHTEPGIANFQMGPTKQGQVLSFEYILFNRYVCIAAHYLCRW